MKKAFLLFALLSLELLVIVSFASAQRVVQESIRSRANCNSLSFQQLDEIGSYIIERAFHRKSGFINQVLSGGNPQILRQFHIRIAREFYCSQPSGMREALQSLRNIRFEAPSQKIMSNYRINSCQ